MILEKGRKKGQKKRANKQNKRIDHGRKTNQIQTKRYEDIKGNPWEKTKLP
jgi:hypothetical protein